MLSDDNLETYSEKEEEVIQAVLQWAETGTWMEIYFAQGLALYANS